MVGAAAGAGAFFAGIYIDAWRFRRGQEILAEREEKRRARLKEGLLMQRAAGTLSGREYERRLQELEEEAGPPAARAADGAKECSPHPQRLLCYTCPGHSGAGHFLHLWPRVATPTPPPWRLAASARSLRRPPLPGPRRPEPWWAPILVFLPLRKVSCPALAARFAAPCGCGGAAGLPRQPGPVRRASAEGASLAPRATQGPAPCGVHQTRRPAA